MADRAGTDSRPDPLFHHHRKYVRQRAVDLAEQSGRIVAGSAVACFHPRRQRDGAVPHAGRGFRHRAIGARLRLVDGWAAGPALGCAVSRASRTDRGDLHRGPDVDSQSRFSRRHSGDADHRPGLEWPALHLKARARVEGLWPGVRGVGVVASVLSRAALSRGRLHVARGLPGARLGSQLPAARCRQPAVDDRDVEAIRHQRQRSISKGLAAWRLRRLRRTR